MTKIEKVLYTGKTHTTGGRDGVARSDDAQLDLNCRRRAAASPEPIPSSSLRPAGLPASSVAWVLLRASASFHFRRILQSMPKSILA